MWKWIKTKFRSSHSEYENVFIAGSSQPTPPTRQISNNCWYRLSEQSDIVIIFVHGLNSDSQQCWTAEDGSYWPDFLKSDKTFDRAAIYLGGYFTGINSADYDIAQCAGELFRALEFVCTDKRAPLDFQNICFVCHSLGGIVVRRMIEEHTSVFKDKRIGLVLMASPSLGADYGKILSALAKLYSHKTGLALKSGGQELKDIDDRFRQLLDNKDIPYFYGAEAAEHKPLLAPRFLPRFFDPVVKTDSASRYFGNLKIIPNTNHLTIVKPDCSEHQSHRFLSHFFKVRYLPNLITATPVSPSTPSLQIPHEVVPVSTAASVLFDIYDSSCAPYYLSREVDKEFVRKLEFSTVWVTGPSACGKTSLVRRVLRDGNKTPVEVTLSHCGSHPSEEYCLAEILDTASPERFDGKLTKARTFSELVDVLSGRKYTGNIALFIDEVPADSSESLLLQPFVKFLSDLLDSVKKRMGSGVRFVICSVERPQIHPDNQKLLGQLSFIHMPVWSPQEITELLHLMQKYLPNLNLGSSVMRQAVEDSAGSPRFLKKFIGQLLLMPNASPEEQLRILAETTEHFGAMSCI